MQTTVQGMIDAATLASDMVLFAAHSFVQTACGGVTTDGQRGDILYSDWPGSPLSDFVPFGSTGARWELDGNARNAVYARHDIALCDGMTITDRGNDGYGVAGGVRQGKLQVAAPDRKPLRKAAGKQGH